MKTHYADNFKYHILQSCSYWRVIEKIFFSDCRPKGEKVNINPVSVVFPYYNSSVGLYQLMTFRSVTAVAEVNRLGYIVQNLEFSEGAFRPYFTEFSIEF